MGWAHLMGLVANPSPLLSFLAVRESPGELLDPLGSPAPRWRRAAGLLVTQSGSGDLTRPPALNTSFKALAKGYV